MPRPLIVSDRLPTGRSYLAGLVRRAYRIRPGARAVPSGEDTPALSQPRSIASTNPGAGERLVHDGDPAGVVKALTDVLVVGSAHTRGRALTVLDTAVQVERARKAVRVWGDRRISLGRGGAPEYGAPTNFSSLPILYDHAYGGRDLVATKRLAATSSGPDDPPIPGVVNYPRNDAGRCYVVDTTAERLEGLVAPNLEDPTDPVTPDRLVSADPEDWIDLPVAAGYGPIDLFTFPRAAFLFPPAFRPPRRPIHEIALGGLLREDLFRPPSLFSAPDPRVQNCAPAGLAVCRLNGGERVSLWNLHRHHDLLEIELPVDTPRILVELPGVGTREMPPLLHTVLIEPDEDRITLAWAGSIDVAIPYPEEMTRTLRCAAIWADGSTEA